MYIFLPFLSLPHSKIRLPASSYFFASVLSRPFPEPFQLLWRDEARVQEEKENNEREKNKRTRTKGQEQEDKNKRTRTRGQEQEETIVRICKKKKIQ